MRTFYKIENNKPQVGQGTIAPPTFVEYVVGQEPLELVEALAFETSKSSLEQRIAESKQYINDTGWIWEKYNRNVLVLKDLTDEEFRLKYNDIINLQEESRLLINTLEIELNNLIGVE